MPHAGRWVAKVVIAAVLLALSSGSAVAEITNKGRQVSVRFPAFSLSPGERISGVRLTTTSGRISNSCMPGRWRCDHQGSSIHCYSMHAQYATAISGMLPEIFISDTKDSFSISASVEFIDNSGKEYSKEIRESELIVK